MSTPEPPPVQRPQAPSVQSIPGPPPVQRSQATTPPSSAPSKWKWWPDHPGKRVMLVAVALWLLLVIPAFMAGTALNYVGAEDGKGTNHYVVGNEVVTQREMQFRAIATGISLAGAWTTICTAAVIVGGIMTLAIEKRRG